MPFLRHQTYSMPCKLNDEALCGSYGSGSALCRTLPAIISSSARFGNPRLLTVHEDMTSSSQASLLGLSFHDPASTLAPSTRIAQALTVSFE